MSSRRPGEELFFNEEQLRALSLTTMEMILAAIDSEDVNQAIELCARASANEHEPIRNVYRVWSAQTQSYIYGKFGIDALRNLLVYSVATWLRPLAEEFRNGVTKLAISKLAQLIRTLCDVKPDVTEDSESFTFSIRGWGAQSLETTGAYSREALFPLAVVSEAADITGYIPNTPIYRCVARTAEKLMIDWLGYPAFFIATDSSGNDLLKVCKAPSAVPTEVFRRVGKLRDEQKLAAACGVAGGRMFDESELRELELLPIMRVREELEAGSLERARALAEMGKFEWFPAHHLMRDWMASQLSWLHQNHPQLVREYFQEVYEKKTLEPMLSAVERIDFSEAVGWFAATFRQHAMRFHAEEDGEKVTLVTEPCGSGGRLIAEGAYEAGKGLVRVESASAQTFNLEDFPAYCLHCPATNRVVLGGKGPYYQVVEPGIKDGRLTGHCKFHFFKGRGVPEKLYHQVGLKAPKPNSEGGLGQ